MELKISSLMRNVAEVSLPMTIKYFPGVARLEKSALYRVSVLADSESELPNS